MRGWLPFYRTSWRLGLAALAGRHDLREALTRIIIPLDPSRYLEFPDALRELGARPGERVLDLASPKLVAVELARRGAEITSVDALDREVALWRSLARGQPRLSFQIADGRALPFAEAAFDRAYSISVLEHIPNQGDAEALRELARVVRSGGRVVVTVPYSDRYREDWRDVPMYGDQPAVDGRYFFERWYDDDRLRALAQAAPGLRLLSTRISRMAPNWHLLYLRAYPWLLPLGPFFGVLARERVGPPGEVARLTFERLEP
jgi:SAM-dependent methyltransferase